MEITNTPVEASIVFNEGKITYSFTAFRKEVDGRLSVYIPAYNMFLSAKDKEDVHKKTLFMVKSFYDFYLKQNGIKSFMLEIHKLGFRTKNHDLIMKSGINGKPVNSKFNQNIPVTPEGFDMAEAESFNMEEMVAC